ncbi:MULTISPECIES: ATP-grasp domain-containing protein [unclassified Streptomyces]|uniref:ATP-grasp domain-containing protein n=1 Tax=unclassified Streptomyces TaxID=2593676 RepID=UPI000CD51EA4|nr:MULTISPECIES: ATP-grasp domain-containing protein [unclassified Streptomyces]
MTPSHQTAVLLSPSPAVVRAVRAVGARSLVLAADLTDPAVREAALSADDAIAVDWTDHPRLLGVLSHFADSPLRGANRPRAAVFGFGETSALAAARANEALGLPGNPHAAVAYLTDKAALRDRVNQLAATPVRFERCDRAAALVPAAERVGFPCVVKPRTGSGGQEVHKLHDAAEAHTLARQLAPEPAFIVEEYLDGPEYCVETHSARGKHTVLAVARKHTTGAPECGDIGYELPADLGKRALSKIHKLVEATLNAAGQRSGPSHTEVVLTERGPALIESHAHPGVDRISELLTLATGVDRYQLAIATTLDLPEPKPAARDQHAAARLLPLTLQTLHDAERAADARAVPGVVSVELGAPLGSHAPAATSRVAGHGVITATGATPQEVARALRAAEDRLIPARATSSSEGSSKEEELSAV